MANRSLVPAPSVVIWRRSLRRGLLGDSRLWKVVGLAILGRRLFQRAMRSEPRTVAVERLRPGETLVLRAIFRGDAGDR